MASYRRCYYNDWNNNNKYYRYRLFIYLGFVWLDNFSTNIKSFSCAISTVMN